MIAVSGIGIVSALGIGVEENLKAFREGRSGISPRSSLTGTTHVLPAGELPVTNEGLCERLGIGYDAHISRTALLGALAVKEALADAGITDASKVGLISSTSVGGMDLTEHFFPEFIQDPQSGDAEMSRMHDCAASTRWIAAQCGIGGHLSTISTACSSAANAMMTGARLIEHGLLDTVVVGGTDALSMFTINGFKSLMILDSEPSRPFDQTRAGLNLGEGAGYIVLQARDKAQEGDYCALAGFANANDAHHQTASSAEGDGDFLAMTQALEMAGLTPADVDYINVHGTGTGNNDQSEGTALRRIWGDNVPPFSSTKGFTGHTLAAAGGIEAVLSVLSVSRGIIWPNLRFSTPIEGLGLVPETRMEEGREIKAVVSNSFGFGGNCSSVVFSRSGKTTAKGAISACYIENILEDNEVVTDVKELIPDAGMRRRMSKVLKNAVSTATECVGGAANTAEVDCIVTATGLGCLSDSEKFLLNIIRDKEELLNPTPFIQSTFNTVGGQVALLSHNHCYNMTYVNRSDSFRDALLDAMMHLSDAGSGRALAGAFDENIPASEAILARLGAAPEQDGSVFALLSAKQTPASKARLVYKPAGKASKGILATDAARQIAAACRSVCAGNEESIQIGDFIVERI